MWTYMRENGHSIYWVTFIGCKNSTDISFYCYLYGYSDTIGESCLLFNSLFICIPLHEFVKEYKIFFIKETFVILALHGLHNLRYSSLFEY